MLGFTALVLILIPVFIALGMWQWDRFEERSAATAQQDANVAADPVPFHELTEVGDDVSAADRWQATTLTGVYDTDHELLVRQRSTEGGPGFYVVIPLVTDGGPAALINRGWVPQDGQNPDDPDVPAPPDGEVTVSGNAQFEETESNTGIRDRGGLPEGQIMLINSVTLADDLPYPVYGGHVERTGEEPSPEAAPMAIEPSGYNYGLNAAYAVQWWVFALMAAGGLWYLIRRELQASSAGNSEPAPDVPEDDHSGVGNEAQPQDALR